MTVSIPDPHNTLTPSLWHLKGRLREFWDAQSVYWSMLTEETEMIPGLRAVEVREILHGCSNGESTLEPIFPKGGSSTRNR
jgi:hypothetical protein